MGGVTFKLLRTMNLFLAFLVLFTTQVISVAEADGGRGCDGAAEEALRLTNQYRAKHGVGPLELDPRISAKSQSWADDLHRRGFSSGDPHSDFSRGAGLYNTENIGETPTWHHQWNCFTTKSRIMTSTIILKEII